MPTATKQQHKTSKTQSSTDGKSATDNVFGLDDETWTRLKQQAAQSGVSTSDMMKQYIVNAIGAPAPEGAWHSGQETDPSLK